MSCIEKTFQMDGTSFNLDNSILPKKFSFWLAFSVDSEELWLGGSKELGTKDHPIGI